MSETRLESLSPREKLIVAGTSVFSQRGYEAGSLNDVAELAGMSRHNLLYYYPSKRDLLIAVLDARDEQADARLRWMETSIQLRLPEFLEGLDGVLPTIYADRELMQLYHRLTTEATDDAHPAHPWVRARYERIRSATIRIFDAARHRGELADGLDPEGLAIALLGAIEGIESQWLVDPRINWSRATNALRTIVELATRQVI